MRYKRAIYTIACLILTVTSAVAATTIKTASVPSPVQRAEPHSNTANVEQTITELQQQIHQVQRSVAPQIQAQAKITQQSFDRLQKQTEQQLTVLQKQIAQVQSSLVAQIRRMQKEISQLSVMR